MAPSADEFLNDLARKDLVSAEILASLRRQIAGSSKPVAAQTIAKLLVDKGHLTPLQSQRLLGMPAAPASAPAKPAAPGPAKSAAATTPAANPKPAASTAPVAKPAAQPAAKTPAKPAPPPADDAGLAPLDDLAALDSLGGDDLLGGGSLGADPFAQPAGALGGDALSPATAGQTLAPIARPAASAGPNKLLIGGIIGGVLLLAGIAVAVVMLIPKSHDNLLFDLAEKDYEAKEYAAAIEKYTALLTADPTHPRAGTARVHRAAAQIFSANPASKNWATLLPIAKQSLAEVVAEPEIASVQADLAPVLTDMAAGLAEQARQGKSAQDAAALLTQARDALALANDSRLIPAALRQWQRLADAEEALAVVGRDGDRSAALAAALQAASGGKLDAALAQRGKLLAAYPELAGDAQLASLGQQLAKDAVAAIKPVSESKPAETSEPRPAVTASLALALRQPAASEPPAGAPVFVLAGGSAWGLDSASGKLLWRKPVGADAGPAPLALAGGDALLVDAARREVARVAGSTGALRWRQACDGPLDAQPIPLGSEIVVATRSGKLFAFDAASGEAKHSVQLPLDVRVAPALDSAGKRLYVLSDNLFLFVLDAADLSCLACAYLGHEAAGTAVPPVLMAGRLIAAENLGLSQAVLHVVPLDEAGLPSGGPQRVDIPGQILSPPVVLGDRLVVLTDGGRTFAFSAGSDSAAPLKKLEETTLAPPESLVRHAIASGGKLWVAASGLSRLDFQPTTGKLSPLWQGFAGSVANTPPQVVGDLVVSVRRESGRPGVVVAALRSATGTTAWETRLAAPLAAPPVVTGEGKPALAASSWGLATHFELATWKGATVRESPPTAGGAKGTSSISGGLVCPDGRAVFTFAGSPNELLVLDAGAKEPRLVSLPSPLAGPPLAWSGGVVMACVSGVVCWLGPEAGAVPISAYQLRMQAGSKLAGSSLAGAEGVLVLSDGRGKLVHLTLQTMPQPHLVEVAAAQLESPAVSPVAVREKIAVVVTRGGNLASFELPDLTPGSSLPLAAQGIAWGPAALGSGLVLITGKGELVSLDSTPAERWRTALAVGPIAGAACDAAGNVAVAGKQGMVVLLAADSGKELTRASLAQPLAGAPFSAGNDWLAIAADGTLLRFAFAPREGAP